MSTDLPAARRTSSRSALEAILVVAPEPVPAERVAEVLELETDLVRSELQALRADYASAGRGIALREVAGGWQLAADPAHTGEVVAYLGHRATARLSPAALETLAVIAYQQPTSRARVAAVRGVAVDGVVRTLLARGLVREEGIDPGTGAVLLCTTELLLRRLGLRTLDELPPLAPLLPAVETLVDGAGAPQVGAVPSRDADAAGGTSMAP